MQTLKVPFKKVLCQQWGTNILKWSARTRIVAANASNVSRPFAASKGLAALGVPLRVMCSAHPCMVCGMHVSALVHIPQ